MEKSFNINRVLLLIKRQLSLHIGTYIIAFSSLSGLLSIILFWVLIVTRNISAETFMGITFPFLFLEGILYTSIVFKELNSPLKSYMYLMLPVTIIEKLLASWLLSSVFYLFASITVLYIVNIFVAGLGSLFLSTDFFIVNLFTQFTIKFYGIYLIVQTIFMVGAIAFRNMNFFKTILSAFISLLGIGVFCSLVFYLLFGSMIESNIFDNANFPTQIEYFIGNFGASLISFSFWVLTAPFFMLVAYFKLKERQL